MPLTHNSLILVCISPQHVLITSDKRIESIAFQVNLQDAKPSGRGKRGSAKLQGVSVLCTVTTHDGVKYMFVWCVRVNS